jgi:hypothetical protein
MNSRRRREIRKETPNADAAKALKRTIKSLVDDGVEADRFKEPEKRRQSRVQKENSDEKTIKEMTKDLVDTIVSKFLEEQESAQENTLKIEIVEDSQSSSGEGDQESEYLMIAKLQVGRDNDCEDKEGEIPVKVMRLRRRQKRRQPPCSQTCASRQLLLALKLGGPS